MKWFSNCLNKKDTKGTPEVSKNYPKSNEKIKPLQPQNMVFLWEVCILLVNLFDGLEVVPRTTNCGMIFRPHRPANSLSSHTSLQNFPQLVRSGAHNHKVAPGTQGQDLKLRQSVVQAQNDTCEFLISIWFLH